MHGQGEGGEGFAAAPAAAAVGRRGAGQGATCGGSCCCCCSGARLEASHGQLPAAPAGDSSSSSATVPRTCRAAPLLVPQLCYSSLWAAATRPRIVGMYAGTRHATCPVHVRPCQNYGRMNDECWAPFWCGAPRQCRVRSSTSAVLCCARLCFAGFGGAWTPPGFIDFLLPRLSHSLSPSAATPVDAQSIRRSAPCCGRCPGPRSLTPRATDGQWWGFVRPRGTQPSPCEDPRRASWTKAMQRGWPACLGPVGCCAALCSIAPAVNTYLHRRT